MMVAKVCERVAPATVSPLLKSMCWAPSTGFTPKAGPFTKDTVPGRLSTQPVIFEDPVGSACPPGATTGVSKLPFVNGPAVGDEELATTDTLSSNRSTEIVAVDLSVNAKV